MNSEHLDRRRLLQSATLAGLASGAVNKLHAQSSSSTSIIRDENSLRGSTDWQLTRVRPNRGKYRTSLVEGYCSHQSIRTGDTLSVFVNTEPKCDFRLEIYRMGYYGGAGARKLAAFGPLKGITQPTPERGDRRIRECRWEPSLEIRIPNDWVSGVYLGKLTTESSNGEPYWQSYVIFIVRDDRTADLLFQCSDNTWQAYNRWPENDSLYTHPDGAHHPGVAVSFDRPYGMYPQIFDHPLSMGSGEFLLWEYPLCYWLESLGYDVTYCSNRDIVDTDSASRGRIFLSVGMTSTGT